MFLRLNEMILVKKLAEYLAYLLFKIIITITATVIITVSQRAGPNSPRNPSTHHISIFLG